MAKTAPRPIVRTLHQTPLHRITVDVTQLLDPLGLTPNIKVVIARLPQQTALRRTQATRDVLLEDLQRDRKLGPFRFADQQMNVFGHDHVPGEVESIPLPRLLEGLLEDVAGPRCAEKGSALIAAKRHKVQTACFLKALEAPRHDSSVTQRLDCETRDAKTSRRLFRKWESQHPRPVAKNATRTGHPLL